MNKLTDDRYETRRRDNGEQARHERKVLMWLGALIVIGFAAGQALATPWTDEHGNPNPRCLSEDCHKTGIPDTPQEPREHREPATPPKEVHNGFSCYFAPQTAWVYHPAARFNMTPAHDSSAKNEALDRMERLGDAVAMTKVCRPWQIKAGFKIAEVM
jgi:hypothetical protein